MTAGTATAVIISAVAVLGTLLTMARLVFLAGRLEGRVEQMLDRFADDRERIERDIAQVSTRLAGHEAWHRGPHPARR